MYEELIEYLYSVCMTYFFFKKKTTQFTYSLGSCTVCIRHSGNRKEKGHFSHCSATLGSRSPHVPTKGLALEMLGSLAAVPLGFYRHLRLHLLSSLTTAPTAWFSLFFVQRISWTEWISFVQGISWTEWIRIAFLL